MIIDFFRGCKSPVLATLYVVRTPTLWRYIIIPIVFVGVCLLGGLITLYFYAHKILSYLASFGVHVPTTAAAESWLAYVQEHLIYYGSYVGIWILGILMSYMLTIIVAPMLSEPVSDQMVNKKNWKECIHAGTKAHPWFISLGESLFILFVQFILTVACFFMGFIPLLGFFAPVLVGCIAIFVLAKELLDVPLARHGISFSAKMQIIRARPGLFLGFGSAVLLMAMIPLYNIVLFPIAVVAITQIFYEHIWQDHKDMLLVSRSRVGEKP